MRIFPDLFKELKRPDDQGRDWYGWACNQMAHVALGFMGAVLFNITVVLLFAAGKEAFDLYKGGKPTDSLADLTFWGIGAFFLTAPGFATVFLSILLLAGIVKRFKEAKRG
jgi:UPF0716 family protein affecting phage T7 exclusion